ncbi:HD domain-containing phosphohydrolase [Aromatoleum bremense]|uniref:HD domain-containing protein n=1 Tax=Aromatoleum bremense TaxID=76115 RepID=A0ABX1NVQ8_9RHOO|nr:HD domain-containing phosphohydrolase [Aromatoleum bremense]NMG16104.1 HD domain-containing protein [Aromatoleum bremense]QTQ30204.1 Putative phosphodiesterase [Aromatoleum bremense]
MNLRSAIGKLLGPASCGERDHELLASLLVMAWMVEARDPYTGGHLWRVSRYAELLASHAQLASAEVARVAVGGFLHDLGKICLPDAILRKPGALDAGEFATVRTHPEVGVRLLAAHPFAPLVRPAVALHHERPDGRGYPLGLADAALPLDARIVAICDAFDAMTSTRPYRTAMPIDAALDVVAAGLGGQFDAEFGARFLSLADTGALEHIAGHSDAGIPLQTCMMCGPTLVLARASAPGELVYCRACGGEYRVTADASGRLGVEPTGGRGDAHALQPEADVALIARVVQSAAARLPLQQMLESLPQDAPI